MKVTCIVPAAGRGKRLKRKDGKILVTLEGKPLLFHTLKALDRSGVIDEIILVVSPDRLEDCKRLVRKHNFLRVTSVVPGGKKRFNSVKNGLRKVKDADIVVIHDGARPLIDADTVKKIITAAKKYGASVVARPSKQTLKAVDKKLFITNTPRRKFIWEADTPQAFRTDLIRKAYEKTRDTDATDDSVLLERLGHRVKIVEGSPRNIKITTPEDLALAKVLLKRK